ncbi:MAG: PAS domain-containing sensor histidine kinase [SAR86 cluster bacterium]|uniref:histidine kinase n=1 Tax=SAR86 cluster bacterium TaxID=2030880 RepID=A0A2A4X257_9GAMM|nr:MAG: PAS domain-containing sensor histidine kinase [SAR86 cluster bacterium]
MFFSVLFSAIPVIILLFLVFLNDDLSLYSKVGIAGFCFVWLLAVAASVREKFVFHVRTLSNLIEAIRTEDYSMRGSRIRDPGELAELYQQINTLTTQLKEVREEEFELSNLLERIVNQINVAIVACDNEGNIRLANRLAKKLLDKPSEKLVDKKLQDTVLQGLLSEDGSQLIDFEFPGATGRWQVNQQQYRHHGKPGKIIFITDLKQVLSEEEISAWQRLIRVIAHEVNNSLTPIISICQTLGDHLDMLESTPESADSKEGLAVIEERAKGLRDFISVYARIAKLPEPQKINFSVFELLQKVKRFFVNESVEILDSSADFKMFGDPVHLEQVLINLIKNALEASGSDAYPVEISCQSKGGLVEFVVTDSGKGISNPANLFVPFYTTKDKGAGIGLTLSRQIAAKHGGQLLLENRAEGSGAVARLQIPITVS